MNLITRALIKLLVASITPKAAKHVNSLLIEFLDQLADKTTTQADDELVDKLRHFLKTRRQETTKKM